MQQLARRPLLIFTLRKHVFVCHGIKLPQSPSLIDDVSKYIARIPSYIANLASQ